MRPSLKLESFKSQSRANVLIKLRRQLAQISSGLILTSGLAGVAFVSRSLLGLSFLSPLTLAIILGIFIRNTVGVPQVCQPGITFSLKRILKLGIILLGFQLNLMQVITIGSTGIAIAAASVFMTFIFTIWAGQWLGVSKKLTQLIAAGTSICGASAVVATSAAIDSSDEDVAYAVALVTVFGATSMLLYPILPSVLSLTPQAFGLWCGASIHEVAQAIAAAFQSSNISGEVASVSKLSRVILLAPISLILAFLSTSSGTARQRQKLHQVPIPWFVLGFIVLILINSLNLFPEAIKITIIQGNQFLLTIALAAMGLETKINHLKKIGLNPLYLGTLSWIFISVFSLTLIKIFY